MSSNDSRYKRQLLVNKLGPNAQQKLSDARVLIVGAGGLGSPTSLLLAGAGVGKITLVDPDTVSLSNLHRQILFGESDIGKFKSTAGQQRLRDLNSEIEIKAINEALIVDNAERLVSQATVVVDAADNFLVSYLLSDLCLEKRIPLVSASVLTTHGYLGVFCGTRDKPAPSLRAVFPAPSSDINNCNSAGVTGPSVGIIGSYQAQEVLKVIVQSDSQLLGKLMNLDLWDYRQYIIDFNESQEPKQKAKIVSLSQLNQQSLLLDVRGQQEVDDDPIINTQFAGSIKHIPLDQLNDRLNELEPNTTICCICKSGQRALNSAQRLIDNGYNDVLVSSR